MNSPHPRRGRCLLAIFALLPLSALDVAAAESPRSREPAGQVMRSARRKAPSRPKARGVAWRSPKPVLHVAVGEEPTKLEVSWKKTRAAASYLVEVSESEGFEQVVTTQEVPARVTRFTAPGLPPGQYYVRVLPLDKAGSPGKPSRPKRVDLVRLRADNGQVTGNRIRGSGSVVLTLESSAEVGLKLDGKTAYLPVTVSKLGSHSLKITQPGKRRPLRTLTIIIERPRVTSASQATDGLELAPLTSSSSPDPVKPPAPDSPPPPVIEPPRLPPGETLAQAPPSPEAAPTPVEAIPPASPLPSSSPGVGEDTSANEAPVRLAGPEVSLTSVTGYSATSTGAPALPVAFTYRGAGAELRLQPGAPSSPSSLGARVTLALHQEVSERADIGLELSGRSTLGALMPSTDASLSVTFSGRWALPLEFLPGVLAVSLQDTFVAGPSSALQLRGALLYGLRFGNVALATSHGLNAVVASTGTYGYQGAAQAWFLPAEWLALSAGAEWMLPVAPAAPFDLAAAAGVSARLGDVDLGVSARLGLGPPGGSAWGALGGLLTVGLRR